MCRLSHMTGPLRRGRPSGSSKEHNRMHPYSRRVQSGTSKLHCSALLNGNSHTTTLAQGGKINGTIVHPSIYESPLKNLYTNEREAQGVIETQEVQSDVSESTWEESHLADRIVWAPGKQSAQIAIRLQRLTQEGGPAVAVRVSAEVAEEIQTLLPAAKYNSQAQAISVAGSKKQERLAGTVAIIVEDADDSVAEEALIASSALGCYSYKLATNAKKGLAGIAPNISAAQSADVVIVVARTEATLPMVVAGMVEAPVIAVPTTCSEGLVASYPGVSVVGRDNGLAAILLAHRILKTAARLHSRLGAVAK